MQSIKQFSTAASANVNKIPKIIGGRQFFTDFFAKFPAAFESPLAWALEALQTLSMTALVAFSKIHKNQKTFFTGAV
jgi:hypothetical protein